MNIKADSLIPWENCLFQLPKLPSSFEAGIYGRALVKTGLPCFLGKSITDNGGPIPIKRMAVFLHLQWACKNNGADP